MGGACPPSSIVTGFITLPAAAASSLPTGMEPVNVTFATAGAGIR